MSESNTQLAQAIAALLSATAAVTATPQAPETVLTVQEAAERLKISRGLVYAAIKDGTIRSVRIGKRRLIPTGEIQRLIDSAS
jgi:excisionase family DNA binding protein